MDEIIQEHLLYALLISIIDDIGGIVKLSYEDIKKIISEKKLRLDLYQEGSDIFIELVEDEDKAEETV